MQGSTQFTRRTFLARAAGVVGGATLAASGITLATQGSASAGAGWFPGMLVAVNTDVLTCGRMPPGPPASSRPTPMERRPPSSTRPFRPMT